MSAPHRRRILVVEDEDSIRGLLTEFLELRGYAVEGVTTAVGAFAAIRERPADVVLLDLQLPGVVSGIEAVPALARDARVIIISGTEDTELARSMFQLGAFDYLTKPFNLERVAAVVDAAMLRGGAA